jgi:predicted membrane protein
MNSTKTYWVIAAIVYVFMFYWTLQRFAWQPSDAHWLLSTIACYAITIASVFGAITLFNDFDPESTYGKKYQSVMILSYVAFALVPLTIYIFSGACEADVESDRLQRIIGRERIEQDPATTFAEESGSLPY